MKKISVGILLLVVSLFIYSCTKDDGTSVAPPRDYSEQYLIDIDSIDEFIDTHYMTVDTDLNPTFHRITSGETSIRLQTEYPLESVQVKNFDDDGEEFEYKVYYIKLREGNGQRPSRVDSIHVAYTGDRIYTKQEEILPSTNPKTYNYYNENLQFETTPNPVWFQLEAVVPGWAEIIPLFKTGTYDPSEGPNPVTFDNYGAGIMFLPSALGYYNSSSASGVIPAYSNLIFSFKLYELQYKDHDRDKILSKDEVTTPLNEPFNMENFKEYNSRENFLDFDTDGDGFANMFDIDDDGDGYQTKGEIRYSVTTGTPPNEITTYFYYPFADIPTCGTGGNGKKKHLDPFCH